MFKKSSHKRIIFLPSFIILFVSVFLLTFKVNAASEQTYFPVIQNQNNKIPDVVISGVSGSFSSYDHYFIYGPINSDPSYPDYLFVCWSGGDVLGVLNNNGYQFTLTRSNNTSFVSGVYGYLPSNGTSFLRESNYGNFARSLIYYSSIYSTSIDFAVSDDFYNTVNTVLVFQEAPFVVPGVGHAQDPMNNIPTFVPPLGMHPQSPPSVPSYTFPSLATKPVWDSSHPFDSLFAIVLWGFDFSYDLLTGILQNIIDWATFLGNLIVWLYEQLWNYITFFIDWLYRIFEYLFSPIYNFLKSLFHDGDEVLSISDLVYDFIQRFEYFRSNIFQNSWFTQFWNNFSSNLEDKLTRFGNLITVFASIVALGKDPTTHEFSIPYLTRVLFVPDLNSFIQVIIAHDEFNIIDLAQAVILSSHFIFEDLVNVVPSPTFHVPTLIYHGQEIGNFDIDFSWYLDYKIYVDSIISGFLIIGWLYWIILTFKDHLRGHFIDLEPNNSDNSQRLFKG